jgi:hypothetical protein
MQISQVVSRWLPTAVIRGSSLGLVMWDFVVDKVALGQVFSEYFGLPCQSSFHHLLQKSSSSIIWGLYNRPEVATVPRNLAGPGTWAVPRDLVPPPPIIKRNYVDFEVLAAVVMKISVFWDIILCSSLRNFHWTSSWRIILSRQLYFKFP